jgi:uncharacterized protein
MDIKTFFKENSEAAIAFSGGVDSAVLLALAKKYAVRVKAYYVKSKFQPQFELDDALETAELLNADLEIILLDVLSDKEVTGNPENRCYHCKKQVFGEIIKHAQADGFKLILDGTNASDDIDDRPGFAALGELGVASPLLLCGYTKADIRALAREYGLPVADKPSYACLATRIPTGTRITAELLNKTEAAEKLMRKAGYKNFRVRCLGDTARLELSRADRALYSRIKDRTHSLLSPYYKAVELSDKERSDE